MKNLIFIFLVILILAAIGGVGFFWRQEKEAKNANDAALGGAMSRQSGTSRRNSSAPEVLPSSETIAPAPGYQKPAEDSIIKFPVFNYHHIRPMPNVASSTITDRAFTVSPEGFEAHLKYFKDNNYQVVSVYDLLDYFDTGKPLPARAVAITFDDGRWGQYKWAYPLLRQYGMTATFFITTNWIGKADFMTWPQIKEMSENGMTIGSHSLDHAALDKVDDNQLRDELVNSKKILEEKIGPLRQGSSEASKKVDLLAYPGGSYNDHVIQFAKDAGYRAALSVYKIIDQQPKYRFVIRRFHADDALESITEKLAGY